MTPSHKMERQLKALIWQRLAGMFLIDGLHHKLVDKRKSTSLHRHYGPMEAMEKTKMWFACARLVGHMLFPRMVCL